MTRLTEALERARLANEPAPSDRPVARPPAAGAEDREAPDSIELVSRAVARGTRSAADRASTPASSVAAVPEPVIGTPAPELPAGWEFRLPQSDAGAPASHAGLGAVTPDRGAVNGDAAAKLVSTAGTDGAMVEQYRRLAAVLHHAQQQQRARTVMIASAVPAEGKTLTATNLALTLSRSYQRRVLLIDADLRRPSLHTLFGVPNDAGLTTTLREVSPGRLPVHEVSPQLWLMPAGRPDPNPMSILTSEPMKQLLADASSQFDWVVVDTPPVGVMPDANLLADMVDAALVVVSAGTTPYPDVKKAVEALGPTRVLGVVLNRADRSALGPDDRYYGYYGYGTAPRRRAGWKRLAWR